jgi:hypothetical protein
MEKQEAIKRFENFKEVYKRHANDLGAVFESVQLIINEVGKNDISLALAKSLYKLKISSTLLAQENIQTLEQELLQFEVPEIISLLNLIKTQMEVTITNTNNEIASLSAILPTT